MRVLHVGIRRIGNSQGVVIPKPILARLGLDAASGADMTIEAGAWVLRRPANAVREGWAEAAAKIAERGDDHLVLGEFGMPQTQNGSGEALRDLACSSRFDR